MNFYFQKQGIMPWKKRKRLECFAQVIRIMEYKSFIHESSRRVN